MDMNTYFTIISILNTFMQEVHNLQRLHSHKRVIKFINK
jgi:hypothetical protein